MNNKTANLFALSIYTLVCTCSIKGAVYNSIADRTSTQLGASTGNLITEQTYLDHYPVDKGNGPLANVRLMNTVMLSDLKQSLTQLELFQLYYPDINTYTLGGNYVYRMNPVDGYRHGYYAGFDYTHYDQFEFTQAIMGYEVHIYDLDANMSLTVPFGKSQNYSGAAETENSINSQLVAMNSFVINATKKLYDFDFLFQGSRYWHHDTKNPYTGASVGVDYDSGYAKFGILQQYRNGLDTEQWGTRVFINIPLHKGNSHNHHLAQMTKPVNRYPGATISAKEISCGAGFTSYSANGVTTCATENPNNGALLQSGALKQGNLTDIEKLMGKVTFVKGDKVVVKSGIHVVRSAMFYDVSELTIDPGAMLFFTKDGAMITGPKTKVKVGSAVTGTLPSVFRSAPRAKWEIEQLPSGRARTGLLKALGDVTSSPAITAAVGDNRFPSIGLVVLGQSNLDLRNQSFNSPGRLNQILSVHASSENLTSADAMLEITDPDSDDGKETVHEIGGNKSTAKVNEFDNSIFQGVSLRFVAANAVTDKLQFLPANGSAFSVSGGKHYSRNMICQATENSDTCVKGIFGAQIYMRDAVLDLSLASSATSALSLRGFGKATDLPTMTSLIVEDSLLKGKKGTDGAATRHFLDVPSRSDSNSSDGNGYAVAFLNNTFMSRGTPSTVSDPTNASSSITSIGPIKTAQTFVSSNTDLAAAKLGFLGFYGNTSIIETSSFDLESNAKKDALTAEIAGFGNIFRSAGNGSTAPFSQATADAPFTQLVSRISHQSFSNSQPWQNAIAAGTWNGDQNTDNDRNDTVKLHRYLSAATTSNTNNGTQKNDPVTLPANDGSATNSVRATLVATKALTTGGTGWQSRTRATSDTDVFFNGSSSTIYQMRASQLAQDRVLQSYMTDFITGKDLTSYASYTNTVDTSLPTQMDGNAY